MNLLTCHGRQVASPEVSSIKGLLWSLDLFVITFPADDAPFRIGGGGEVTAGRLKSALTSESALSGGLLRWAQYDMASRGSPIADVVDYWLRSDAIQIGVAHPDSARVYHRRDRGFQERGEISVADLMDPVDGPSCLLKCANSFRVAGKDQQLR